MGDSYINWVSPVPNAGNEFSMGNRLYKTPHWSGMYSGYEGRDLTNPAYRFANNIPSTIPQARMSVSPDFQLGVRNSASTSTMPTVNSGVNSGVVSSSFGSNTAPVAPTVASNSLGSSTKMGLKNAAEGVNSSPVDWTQPYLLNQNGRLNFYDSPTMARYGYGTNFNQEYFDNYFKNNPDRVTTTNGLFGSKTTYDYSGLADAMLQDKMLRAQYDSWTPEQQTLWRKDPRAFSYNNVNTMQTQLDAALKAQQNGAWTMKDTMGAIQSGIGVATSLANLYMGFKQQRLAKQQMKETLALQRANYRNTAKAMNAQYRDQMSGRGTTVMSGAAKRQLGQMYANRKVAEDY